MCVNHYLYQPKCLAGAILLLSTLTAGGQGQELPAFPVRGEAGPFFEPTPAANLEFITSAEIAGINATTVEDTIKYLPSLNIRKRYVGDTNGVTAIRGQNPWMTGRSVVTVDGILLSNFLQTRWSGSPRWSAVAPDEIRYSEVSYGPYSAFDSGNALAGSIRFFTRMPEQREVSLRSTFFAQDFSLYDTDAHLDGWKLFTSYGDRFDDLSIYTFYNHLENESHPQTFGTTTGLAPATGEEEAVAGAFLDRDPQGRERIVYSSIGPERVVHDQFKVKVRRDFTDTIEGQLSAVYWKNESEQLVPENYLSNAEGNPVWNGDYRFAGYRFSVNPGDFSVSRRDREDVLLGLTLGGEWAPDWEFDATFSWFEVLEDEERASSRNPLDPLDDGAGRITWLDDTRWLTFDAKTGTQALFGNERLSAQLGYAFANHQLQLNQSDSLDWESGTRDSVHSNTGGETRMHALAVEVGVLLHPDWTLRLGSRFEDWAARDGFVEDANGLGRHPDRDDTAVSPKLSLDYRPSGDWKVSLSLARATRFPLVPELFQGRVGTDGRVDQSNPNLRPEAALSTELSLSRALVGGEMRITVFREEVDETIFHLLDVDQRFSLFLNIDEVLTEGVEFVHSQRGLFSEHLDLRFSASYLQSTIRENPANPAFEGNDFPRVPRWRVKLFGTWHFNDRFSASLGGRYQSHSFNRLENDDPGSGYGSISGFLVFDAKLGYRIGEHITLGVGVDNLLDEEYYVSHPYPQRTAFLEAEIRF